MMIPSVQTGVAKRATNWFNKKYDTELSVERFRYKFPNTVELGEVYLADSRGDTMVYAAEIEAGFAGFNGITNTLGSDVLRVKKLQFNWITYQGDSIPEFQKFIQKFSTGKPPSGNPFGLEIANVEGEESVFHFEDYNCSSCTRFWYRHLNFDLHDFDLEGSYFSLDIDHFSGTDAYGLEVTELNGYYAYLQDKMVIKDVHIKTPHTDLNGDVNLVYTNDQNDLRDFINQVTIVADLDESTVDSKDIQVFASAFPEFKIFRVEGDVEGKVNDLKSENLEIYFGNRTYIEGGFEVKNATTPDSIYLVADGLDLQTNPVDMGYLYELFTDTTLPKQVEPLGSIRVRGDFSGYINKFKTDLELNSEIGDVEIIADFNYPDTNKAALYEGSLVTKAFNLGALLQDSLFGSISSKLSLKGKGFSPETMNTGLKGEISSFGLNDYNYQNMQVNGRIKDGHFRGKFAVDDPNLRFDFNGRASFAQDTSVYDFVATIGMADLFQLNLVKDSVAVISSEMDIEAQSVDFTDWTGKFLVTNTTYENKSNYYFFQDISIESYFTDTARVLAVKSNILDADVTGSFKLAGLAKSFSSHFKKYMRQTETVEAPENHQFDFELTVKNPQLVTEIFLPELTVESNTKLVGSYSSGERALTADLKSSRIVYNKNEVRNLDLDYKGTDVQSELQFFVGSLQLAGGTQFDSIKLGNFLYQDTLFYTLGWILRDSIDSRTRLTGYALQQDSTTFQFGIDSSKFNIGAQSFVINDGNRIYLDSSGVFIEDLVFSNGPDRKMYINGSVSDNQNQILRINLRGFGFDLINYFLATPEARFSGDLQGDILVSQVLGSPKFAATVDVDSMKMNETLLGNLDIRSDWSVEDDTISIAADMSLGDLKTMQLQGFYQPDSTGAIKFDLNFNKFRLAAFNPFVSSIAENLRGYAQGNVKVRGSTGAPELSGELELPKLAFTVSFLQTDYSFTKAPKLNLSADKITFPNLSLRDTKYGTSGILSGEIRHDNFSDIVLDIKVDAEELLVLNTPSSSEDYYYGTAFATGTLKVEGPTDDIKVSANVSTERNTSFNIPLDNATSVKKSEFVTFVDPTKPDSLKKDPIERLSLDNSLSIDFDINVDTDADVAIILSERTGNRMDATGNGNIKLKIDPFSEMELFGTYTVAEGEYRFNLQGLFNKRFQILRGGTVSWNGSPYEARLNLQALYTTRADPTVLISEYSGGRTQVEIYLNISGPLTNPEISFDINLPRASGAVQTVLKNRISTAEQKNQQVFSLLALNSFSAEGDIFDAGNGGGTLNQWDLLANQASAFLNKVTGDYEVSLNYQPGTSQDASAIGVQEEFEVGVSKRFFNNRVTVNSSVDVPVGANQNNSAVTGDFEVEYAITEDGRLRTKAFNRAIENQYSLQLQQNQNYRQGVGLYYRVDYDTWGEFFRRMFGKKEDEDLENQSDEEVVNPTDKQAPVLQDNTN